MSSSSSSNSSSPFNNYKKATASSSAKSSLFTVTSTKKNTKTALPVAKSINNGINNKKTSTLSTKQPLRPSVSSINVNKQPAKTKISGKIDDKTRNSSTTVADLQLDEHNKKTPDKTDLIKVDINLLSKNIATAQEQLLFQYEQLSENLLQTHSLLFLEVIPQKILMRKQEFLAPIEILKTLLASWEQDLANDKTALENKFRDRIYTLAKNEEYYRKEEDSFLTSFNTEDDKDADASSSSSSRSSSSTSFNDSSTNNSSSRSCSSSPSPASPSAVSCDNKNKENDDENTTPMMMINPLEVCFDEEHAINNIISSPVHTQREDIDFLMNDDEFSPASSPTSNPANDNNEDDFLNRTKDLLLLPDNFIANCFAFLENILPSCTMHVQRFFYLPLKNNITDTKQQEQHHHHQKIEKDAPRLLRDSIENKRIALSFLFSIYKKFIINKNSSNNNLFSAFVSRQMMKVGSIIRQSAEKNNNDYDSNNNNNNNNNNNSNNKATIIDDDRVVTVLYWNNGSTSKSFPPHHCCALNCDRDWSNPISRPLEKAKRHFQGRLFDADENENNRSSSPLNIDKDDSSVSYKCRPWIIVLAEAGSKELVSFISSKDELGYTLVGDVQNTGRSAPKSRQDIALFIRNDKVEFIDQDSICNGMNEVNNDNDKEDHEEDASNRKKKSKMMNGRWTSVDLVLPNNKNNNKNNHHQKRIRIIGVHLHRTGVQNNKQDYQQLFSKMKMGENETNNNSHDHLLAIGDFNRNPRNWLKSMYENTTSVEDENDNTNKNVVTSFYPDHDEDGNHIDNVLVFEKDRKTKRLMVVSEETPCMESVKDSNLFLSGGNNNQSRQRSISLSRPTAQPHRSYTVGFDLY